MRLYKRLAKIIMFIAIILITVSVIFLGTIKYKNNIRIKNLNIFSNNIIQNTRPINTRILEAKGIVGTLSGMGNHYSYCTILLVNSNKSMQELESYYSKTTLLMAEKQIDYKINDLKIKVLEVSSDELILPCIDNINTPLKFNSVSSGKDFKDNYFIIFIDGHYKTLENIEPYVINIPIN